VPRDDGFPRERLLRLLQHAIVEFAGVLGLELNIEHEHAEWCRQAGLKPVMCADGATIAHTACEKRRASKRRKPAPRQWKSCP